MRFLSFVAAAGYMTFSLTLKAQEVAPTSADGPFGFAMGMTRDDVEKLAGPLKDAPNSAQGLIMVSRAPKPNESFRSFSLLIGEKAGLCKIVAIGQNVDTSPQGTELNHEFDRQKAQLKALYGKSHDYDLLSAGSILKEHQQWMQALLKRERSLFSVWNAKEGSTLKNSVNGVLLQARAATTSTGYMVLSYELDNYSDCSKSEQ